MPETGGRPGICFLLIKNKIQLSKFEDLIGLIKQFMNQAVSLLVTRRVLPVVQNGNFFFIGGRVGQGSY